MSSKNLIATWLNEISSKKGEETKTKNIGKIKQRFLDQEDPLEINHFQELLSYSSDINSDVRESIAGFIEEAGKKFPATIPDILPPLFRLVSDQVPTVSKRGIRASSWVLQTSYKWIIEASSVKTISEIQEVWNHLNALKTQIISMTDSENEGVRMQVIKFMESVILFQTYLDPERPEPPGVFSLNDMLLTLQGTCCCKLEEEACRLVDELINSLQSSHITSINLITSMGSLGRIAKLRPKFTAKVIEAIIRLRKELPPTLSASQIIGIEKESLRLLEILTAVKIKQELGIDCNPPVKRRLEPTVDPRSKKLKALQKVEISEDLILKNLTINSAVELVIDGIVRVPNNMAPDDFAKKYPGFSVPADLELQRRSIAKLLATQLKQSKKAQPAEIIQPKQEILLPVNELDSSLIDSEFMKLTLMTNIGSLSSGAKEKLLLESIDRIICSQESFLPGEDTTNKVKILLRVATFNTEVKKLLLIYVSEDVKKRLDLALSLVYEEYALNHGFKRKVISKTPEAPFRGYNFLVTSIVSMIKSHPERESLLTRFYLAVPVIPKKIIESLTSEAAPETLNLMRELIFRRPTNKLEILKLLLGLSLHPDSRIVDAAVGIVVELFRHREFREFILEYLKANLKFLRFKNPPEVLLGENFDKKAEQSWSETTVRCCLKLYQALVKEEKRLIELVVQIYPSMTAEVRKPVKKLMESSIVCFGANSLELLRIVETCPKGAECLVTRFVHTLTENKTPSGELVKRMREIYKTRSLDVVFLIPVLRGLRRDEVFAILPKLVTRNTMVTKEVIKRLFFGIERTELVITPAEFMIAVHNFKKDVADLKTVMICISLCLNEKAIFTREVVQIVVSRLVDQSSLPIILMRTVMQTLPLYPKMEKFVVGVLQKLILKKVWEQPKIWQGFAKCCEMIKEKSFAVIHQLPQEAIDNLLKIVPGLKNSYIGYLKPKSGCGGDYNGSLGAIPFVSIV